MSAADLKARRDEVIRKYGPWTAYNLDLGQGVFTMGVQTTDRMAERRVARIVRAVEDAAPKPLSELRMLDLGCYEGGVAIALAQRGAKVLGLEAREEHVAKARFAADALGLRDVEFVQADVRDLSVEQHGTFDVVLCLGILYHLDSPDCFEFMQQVHDVCDRLLVLETQFALRRPRHESWRGGQYAGLSYPEETVSPGAAIDNPQSFWLTKPSLLNLVTDVGFTSISELLTPVISDLAAFRDHTTLLAWKGDGAETAERWPERLPFVAHREQGRAYRFIARAAEFRGEGIRKVFPKN